MGIRLTFPAAAAFAVAVVAVVPVSPAGSDIGADGIPAVRPGTYRIATADGECLRGEGTHNAKVYVGACDTTWAVAHSGGGSTGGFTIVHTATKNCLSTGLERIYPPFIATLPCREEPAWRIIPAGGGQVTISTETGSAHVTDAGRGRIARLEPAGECPETQRWTLHPA